MRQPKVFSREQVIDTAFNLIRKNGWGSVSARSIAKELGSSTMPIYSNMNSLEELEQELKGKSRACITDGSAAVGCFLPALTLSPKRAQSLHTLSTVPSILTGSRLAISLPHISQIISIVRVNTGRII